MKFIRRGKRRKLSKKDEKEIRRHLEALGYLEKEEKKDGKSSTNK